MFKTIGIITVIIVCLAGLGGGYYWYQTNIKPAETNTITTINNDGTISKAVFDKTIIVKGLETKVKLVTLSSTKSNLIEITESIPRIRVGFYNEDYNETRTYNMIGSLEYSYDLNKIDTGSITCIDPSDNNQGSCNIPLPPVSVKALVDHQATPAFKTTTDSNCFNRINCLPLNLDENTELSQKFDVDKDKLGQERLLQSQEDSEKKTAETEATNFLTKLISDALKPPKTINK